MGQGKPDELSSRDVRLRLLQRCSICKTNQQSMSHVVAIKAIGIECSANPCPPNGDEQHDKAEKSLIVKHHHWCERVGGATTNASHKSSSQVAWRCSCSPSSPIQLGGCTSFHLCIASDVSIYSNLACGDAMLQDAFNRWKATKHSLMLRQRR